MIRGFDKRPGFRSRLSSAWRAAFPERQVLVRTGGTISCVRIGRTLQLFLVLLVGAMSGWMGYASVSYVLHDRIVAAKNREIANVQYAYQNLLDEVATYQRKFMAITRDLEDNHAVMVDLVEQNADLQQDLNSVEQQLRRTRQEKHDTAEARERLKGALAEIQNDLQEVTGHNYLLQDDLDSMQASLQTALRERNAARAESQRKQERVDDLEAQLQVLQSTRRQTVAEMTERTNRTIATMERVVSMTGLPVDALLGSPDGSTAGQGGPFVAFPASLPGDELKQGLSALEARLMHLESLQDAMQRLPLAAPLPAYYVTSSYGKRRDPVNEQWSMHYGLDLGGPFKSGVYASAPGVVTYAGWNGNYGKLVEIDHGNGIKTRYGHLHKVLVTKGQRLGFYDKIGLLGNTGRSTGAHLHYEVQFDDKPQDPMEFIRAGRHVFQE